MKLLSLLVLAFLGPASLAAERPAPESVPAPRRPQVRTRPRRRERVHIGRFGIMLRYWASVLEIYAFSRKKVFLLTRAETAVYVAIQRQRWFDEAWYLETYPDVASAAVDPLHHLVRHGIYEGRLPRPEFAAASRGRVDDDVIAWAHDAYLDTIAQLPQRAVPAPELPRFVRGLDKGHLHRFSDETVQCALARFARFPLFRADDYLSQNASLRNAPGFVAHRHALAYGLGEGRAVFNKQMIANELGLRARATTPSPTVCAAPRDKFSVSIAFNAAGNSFLKEIAECLRQDFAAVGHDAYLLRDTDEPDRMAQHNIIVAPHEFFFIGKGAAWMRDDVLRRSVLFNTEQPQTIWFDRAVPFNMLAKGVIELAPQLAAIYGDCMPALFCDPVGAALEDRLPPADDPILRVLPAPAKRRGDRQSATDARAIDVSFFGGISTHRERFFAASARFFSDYRTFFYCRRSETPLLERGTVDLLEAARHVGFHSKIVLNVHREEFGFFEWHRIVRLGIETGAVVVSEPCLPHPDLRPNEHYFEESGRHIQNLVEWLLRTPDGRAEHARVRANALAAIETRRAGHEAGRRMSRFLSELDGADA